MNQEGYSCLMPAPRPTLRPAETLCDLLPQRADSATSFWKRLSARALRRISAHGPRGVYVAAFAGLVAGGLSMGAGEYVSVSSQADTERADI
jgi:hypothetical protein